MQKLCTTAVENACNRLLGSLQGIIDTEFYDVFTPSDYERTYQFWKSAVTEMLQHNIGAVFMDASSMNYNNYWTGERQLYAANEGSHGGWVTDVTKNHRFWIVFEKYCEENAVTILVEEFEKVGLRTKK